MPDKEAAARIRINKLLETAGRRFFADGTAPANIRLEPGVTIKTTDLDAPGSGNFIPAYKTSKARICVPEYVKDYVALNQFAP